MKKLSLGCAAVVLAFSGTTAGVAQERKALASNVELSVMDDAGKRVELSALSPADRQRVVSLKNSLQQWGNEQSQRVSVTISCKFKPLSCTIIVAF